MILLDRVLLLGHDDIWLFVRIGSLILQHKVHRRILFLAITRDPMRIRRLTQFVDISNLLAWPLLIPTLANQVQLEISIIGLNYSLG